MDSPGTLEKQNKLFSFKLNKKAAYSKVYNSLCGFSINIKYIFIKT